MRSGGSVPLWLAIGACMLIPSISNNAYVVCFPLWVLPWTNEFHVPRSTVLSGFAVGNLIVGFLSPLVGRTLERIPPRITTAAAGLALAAGFAFEAGASSIWQTMIVYASLMAVGAAFTSMLVGQSVAVGMVPH